MRWLLMSLHKEKNSVRKDIWTKLFAPHLGPQYRQNRTREWIFLPRIMLLALLYWYNKNTSNFSTNNFKGVTTLLQCLWNLIYKKSWFQILTVSSSDKQKYKWCCWKDDRSPIKEYIITQLVQTLWGALPHSTQQIIPCTLTSIFPFYIIIL